MTQPAKIQQRNIIDNSKFNRSVASDLAFRRRQVDLRFDDRIRSDVEVLHSRALPLSLPCSDKVTAHCVRSRAL